MNSSNSSFDIQNPAITKLTLPCTSSSEWTNILDTLSQPLHTLADLDNILTSFSALDDEPHVCSFFTKIPESPDASCFDFDFFFKKALPLMIDIALQMPNLFADLDVPIFMMRSTWATPETLTKLKFSLTRQQCACLLAHSFFGSLKRPADIQPNDFRFTVKDLFIGTAVSPNSAITFLNYFSMLAKHGFPDGLVTFERQGYPKGSSPWQWEDNARPLCRVDLVDGSIDECEANLHAEFANAFVGGGVMTGDVAMEEILFLVRPEMMIAMALQHRMVDEEVVLISGAIKYSSIKGFGSSMEFVGDDEKWDNRPPITLCAIDAVRGGGPAMTKTALLRDLNKARIAFDEAQELATGHWGCGAFGNNHDLMFLKQWLAASEAGITRMYYHDFDRRSSHSIFPLSRKLKHLTVGKLWDFLLQLTSDLEPFNVSAFSKRIADVSVGRIEVPV